MIKKKSLFIFSILLITTCLFVSLIHLSYLYRPTTEIRKGIVGFYAEPNSTLDVIYIGASTTYRFYSPMEAWNQKGFTSYVVGGKSTPLSVYKSLIKEIEKSQSPKLLILDAFAIMRRNTGKKYAKEHLTQFAFSLKYSMNRSELIDRAVEYDHKYLSKKDVRDIKWDILTNIKNKEKIDKESFKYMFNNVSCTKKGFIASASLAVQNSTTNDVLVEEKDLPLSSDTLELLNELVEYVKDKDYDTLFVVPPYEIKTTEKQLYNQIEKYFMANDIDYLDANDYYNEMNLNFKTDYYSYNHTNILGAEKFTTFLSSYIADNYDIHNRKREPKYKKWNEEYKVYTEEMKLKRDIIMEKVESRKQ